MSKWDELERAGIAARDMLKRQFISQEELKFKEIATPEAVLSLIEQNREMLEALTMLTRNFESQHEHLLRIKAPHFVRMHEQARSAIRKATGEEE